MNIREEIEKVTRLPFLGHLTHNTKPGVRVVIDSPKSTGAPKEVLSVKF